MTDPLIAVALLTCDRFDYTKRTVKSFARFNDLKRFVLLHADDGSNDPRVVPLVQAYGFRTVVQNIEREGWRDTRPRLLRKASRLAPWILFLENDIETLRPFPWALFDHVRALKAIYCLRLYGRFKDLAKTDPCLTTHKRMGHQAVAWRPLKDAPEKAQVGAIHWSAQPCVTRAKDLMLLHDSGVEPAALTARVKKNVMAHIGVDRTEPRVVRDPLEIAC